MTYIIYFKTYLLRCKSAHEMLWLMIVSAAWQLAH